MVRNSDFCNLWCTQKAFDIPQNGYLEKDDLFLGGERNRRLYFSLVGNKPKNPVVALVGLCPGDNQLKKFISCYNEEGLTLQESAINSGFSKLRKNLIDMLNVLGIDEIIQEKISSDYNFNQSEKFLVTSLVKCASIKDGGNPSEAFDPSKYEMTERCVKNRFVADILNPDFKNMKLVIIMGKHGWSAINTITTNNKTIKDYLESNGKVLVQIPHPSGRNIKYIQKFLNDSNFPLTIDTLKKLYDLS